MAKVDDLLQSGSKQIVLAVVAWLAHGCPPDSESRRRRNHEPPKSGIPKRKKTATHNRLSCKIEYLLRSNHGHSSIASEFFTGDPLTSTRLMRAVAPAAIATSRGGISSARASSRHSASFASPSNGAARTLALRT